MRCAEVARQRRLLEHARDSLRQAQLRSQQGKRTQNIGLYDSEADAAWAYACAAVQRHGTGNTKRKFPDELITEPPE
jgi:hypothetical protein